MVYLAYEIAELHRNFYELVEFLNVGERIKDFDGEG